MDGTFATPALQQPLAGADVVLDSSTKYIGGHSDVQGRRAAPQAPGRDLPAADRPSTLLGAVALPFNSWLVLRGLRTLAVLRQRQSASAAALAAALEGHPGPPPLSWYWLATSGMPSRGARCAPSAA